MYNDGHVGVRKGCCVYNSEWGSSEEVYSPMIVAVAQGCEAKVVRAQILFDKASQIEPRSSQSHVDPARHKAILSPARQKESHLAGLQRTSWGSSRPPRQLRLSSAAVECWAASAKSIPGHTPRS